MYRCNIDNPPIVWDDVVRLGVVVWCKKSLLANICSLAMGAIVYNLWKNE